MNYHNKKFKVVSNSDNGEVTDELIFTYRQVGNVLSCEYQGENIVKGQLIGIVEPNGTINLNYQQINRCMQLRTGVCTSIPEILQNGKIRLHETWEWTNGDKTKGSSILEEI